MNSLCEKERKKEENQVISRCIMAKVFDIVKKSPIYLMDFGKIGAFSFLAEYNSTFYPISVGGKR